MTYSEMLACGTSEFWTLTIYEGLTLNAQLDQ